MCGVSRATVDRVMHNRGKVNPDLEKKIRETAQKYDFRPNHVGRALALAKNPIRIGVLIHLTRIEFFQRLLVGIYDAQSEISALGGEVILKEQSGFNAKEQIALLDELVASDVKGIAISPTQDIRLRNRINELRSAGIHIVTFNTELEHANTLSHVGVDNVQGGRLAAYLMNLLLHGKGGKVLIISGHLTQQTNYQRVDGFVSECGYYYPNIEVTALQLNADKAETAYEITKNAINDMDDIEGVYMVSNGQEGACRAIEECGKAGKIKFITFDLLPAIRGYLEKGVIQFILDQNTHEQGALPPRILFDYLFNDIVPEQQILSSFDIITPYNI